MARPRVLVTGFGAFPGAPVNPTEALVAELQANRAEFDTICSFRTALFPVEYQSLPALLEELAAETCPDIAVHFGLSAAAAGFRLERVARNEYRQGAADNAGFTPTGPAICDLDATYPSTLPLEAIHDVLSAHGLPVDYSDDAGGYLCNFLFYHARSGLGATYRPPVAGFIHVPLFRAAPGAVGLAPGELSEGATLIIKCCVEFWSGQQKTRPEPGFS